MILEKLKGTGISPAVDRTHSTCLQRTKDLKSGPGSMIVFKRGRGEVRSLAASGSKVRAAGEPMR